ncbi:tetratricopeptide repeat protein [Archangium minus]|uniref:Tetratricopeptide repeat protein n=1 Tax=Archangium minus TaxID=83450 RepID=A0ABY9X806_9BACT|nr:tetratricopeptide repeat protein [Archangium minus]
MSRPTTDENEEPFELLELLDESSGPARRISRQRSAELVQGALATFQIETPPAPKRRRWSTRKGMWVTGACLALAGSAAAGIWQWQSSPPAEPAPRMAVTNEAPAPAQVEPPPAPVKPPKAVTPPSEPKARMRVAAAAATEPEDMLRQANERRAQGRWSEAETLYLRVIQSSPGTASAYVAHVASGVLRLEHLGDARGALRQFQQAQRMQPGGMLSEEARQGVAAAWRALGDEAQEARALEAFLAAHPDSLFAEQARHRLKELSSTAQ